MVSVIRQAARFAAIALVSALAMVATPALAREEITSFASDVTLDANGTVTVVETITVRAEGDEIRRGIYRDIPTELINDDKSRVRSSLNVSEVLRDGRAEPWEQEDIGNGFQRIRIGDADVFLNHGEHTYTIRYSMTRMGRFFPDYDELFWNVTGNYWVFPIMKATATLNLPAGARVADALGYTGVPGSQEQAVEIELASPSSVVVRSTRELRPGEGMSAAVAFQKGILVVPEGSTAIGYWLSDHRQLIFPVIAVLIVLFYFYSAWNAVGRDPKRGTIIPLFHPPKAMSPALIHYISTMGFAKSGWTAFTATLFDLGVKGLVKIDEVGKKLRLTVTGDTPDAALPAAERGVFAYVRYKGSVTVDKEDGPELNKKRGELVAAIERENRSAYFNNNLGYTFGGLLLAVLMLGAMVWLDVLNIEFLFVAVIVAVVIGVILGAFFGSGANSGFRRIIPLVWVGIVGFNMIGSTVSFSQWPTLDTGLVGATSIVLIAVVFGILMRAPTIQGRKLMDQIDGFKMYLNTAEKNRLNYVDKGEPVMSVTRFESILPFAIALGVEKPWTERFEGDLARNAVEGVAAGSSYSPGWYRGSNWSTAGSGGMSTAMSAMATSMSAAMIAAQPSTSSGSGFSGGGGGGSGGGGGGGGGGGW